MPRSGFTLLELLIVLGVLALLASFAAAFTRPAHAQRAAQAVRAVMLWARTEAVWRGDAVSVTVDDEGVFHVRLEDRGSPWCEAGRDLGSLRLSAYPGVTLERGLPRGVVWRADGGARSCDGGGVISGRVTLRDRLRAVSVVVSSLGRVRLEETP
jgi:prepilin-type N-terminal cleavage/methylation domain-containing protein